MRSTGYEVHIGVGTVERGTDSGADRTGAEDMEGGGRRGKGSRGDR